MSTRKTTRPNPTLNVAFTKVEPVQAEPVQAEPVQVEPVQVEPVQAEPVQAEPVQAEPVQVEPVQVEPVQAEPVQAEPVQAEDEDEEAVLLAKLAAIRAAKKAKKAVRVTELEKAIKGLRAQLTQAVQELTLLDPGNELLPRGSRPNSARTASGSGGGSGKRLEITIPPQETWWAWRDQYLASGLKTDRAQYMADRLMGLPSNLGKERPSTGTMYNILKAMRIRPSDDPEK